MLGILLFDVFLKLKLYIPSDDSLLLAESVAKYTGKSALEIGIGSGIVLRILHENFEVVAGTDIDFESLRHCKNNISNGIYLVCCDAASTFHCKFDLIVSNPPYLPEENNEGHDSAIHGGYDGTGTILHFIKSATSVLAENGKMLVLVSSLSDRTKIDKSIIQMKLKKRTLGEKKLFFETLAILEVRFG